ncbi:MAG: hypothetical protein Q4F66_06315 [Clostridium sp.]|nr:hypothetical protein [Clostridium sp.]
MNWLRKFMYGRYGVDQFSMALAILSLVLIVISGVLPKSLRIISVLAYIPMFFYLYRTLSKNIFKRQQENYKYIAVKNSALSKLTGYKKRLADGKTHKYFTCPNCKQKLRVPRGNGKITITCPKCRNQFKAKS